MPSLLMYYKSLDRSGKGFFLNKAATECGIGYVTVQQKLGKLQKGKNSFTKLEREKMSEITGISVPELFPDAILHI
jgi:hypothetical protein